MRYFSYKYYVSTFQKTIVDINEPQFLYIESDSFPYYENLMEIIKKKNPDAHTVYGKEIVEISKEEYIKLINPHKQ